MEIIKSNKGKDLLTYDGYIYAFNKKTTANIYWRCQDRTCNAGATTSVDYSTNSEIEHKACTVTSDCLIVLMP
jgi:hypothetical protein